MTQSEPRKVDKTHGIPIFLEALPELSGTKTSPCVVMHMKGVSFHLKELAFHFQSWSSSTIMFKELTVARCSTLCASIGTKGVPVPAPTLELECA